MKKLLEIMNGPDYKEFERAPADSIVLHVRLGDVLHQVKRRLFPDEYYDHMIQAALSKGIKSAVLVTGDHVFAQWQNMVKEKNAEKQEAVLAKEQKAAEDVKKEMDEAVTRLVAKWTSAGMKVTTRVNMQSDCDFIYMSSAKLFVQGNGQFSRLIAHVVPEQGGESWCPACKDVTKG